MIELQEVFDEPPLEPQVAGPGGDRRTDNVILPAVEYLRRHPLGRGGLGFLAMLSCADDS